MHQVRNASETPEELLRDIEDRIATPFVCRLIWGIVMEITADAESEENDTHFEGKTTEFYIKPQNYERSTTKKYKSKGL